MFFFHKKSASRRLTSVLADGNGRFSAGEVLMAFNCNAECSQSARWSLRDVRAALLQVSVTPKLPTPQTHPRIAAAEATVSPWRHSLVLRSSLGCPVPENQDIKTANTFALAHQNYVNKSGWSEMPLKIKSAISEEFSYFFHQSINKKQSHNS